MGVAVCATAKNCFLMRATAPFTDNGFVVRQKCVVQAIKKRGISSMILDIHNFAWLVGRLISCLSDRLSRN